MIASLSRLFTRLSPPTFSDFALHRLTRIMWVMTVTSVLLLFAQETLSPATVVRDSAGVLTLRVLFPVFLLWLLYRGRAQLAFDLNIAAFILLCSLILVRQNINPLALLPSVVTYVLLAYMGRGVWLASLIGVWAFGLMKWKGALADPTIDLLGVHPSDHVMWDFSVQLVLSIVCFYLFVVWGGPGPSTSPAAGPGAALRRRFSRPAWLERWRTPLGDVVATVRGLIPQLNVRIYGTTDVTSLQAAKVFPLALLMVGNPVVSLLLNTAFGHVTWPMLAAHGVIASLGGGILYLLYTQRVRAATFCLGVLLFVLTELCASIFGWVHPAVVALLFSHILGLMLITPTLTQGLTLGIALLTIHLGGMWSELQHLLPAPSPQSRWDVVSMVLASFLTMIVTLMTYRHTMTVVRLEKQALEMNVQQVLTSAPIGIVVLDRDEHVISANQAMFQLLNISAPNSSEKDERLRRTLARIPDFFDNVIHCQEFELPIQYEVALPIGSDDACLQLQVLGTCLYDADRQVVGCQVMLVDLTELKEKELRLRELVDEREKMCRDLHDGILQALFVHGLQLEDLVEQVKERPHDAQDMAHKSSDLIERIIGELQEFIAGQTSTLQPQATFASTLRHYVQTLEDVGHIQIELECPDSLVKQLSAEETEQVQAIAREALSNALRHGQAKHAWVRLSEGQDGLIFEVEDHGAGMTVPSLSAEPVKPSPSLNGNGLRNMRARAHHIGAELSFSSVPGRGTIVRMALRANRRNGVGEDGAAVLTNGRSPSFGPVEKDRVRSL